MNIDERFDRLEQLFQNTFDSLKQEMHQGFGDVNERFDRLEARMDRMEVRLDKIAAGTHYVTRLVDWSEKQDLFQADTLRRLNDLADRVKRLEGGAAA